MVISIYELIEEGAMNDLRNAFCETGGRAMRRRGALASAVAVVMALIGSLVAASGVSAQTDDQDTALPECDETLTPFSDIAADHFAAADVSCMYSLGVAQGTSTTQFSPDATLTRAQISVLMTRLWQALGNACPTGASEPFTDVAADHWAASEIACMYTLGVAQGTSATQFSPDSTLTRAQIAVMAARLWRTHGNTCPTASASFSDVPTDHWAYADIACLQALGIMGAVAGTAFQPGNNATRVQMVMVLARLWRAATNATTTATTEGGGGEGVGGGGGGGQPSGNVGQTPGGSPPSGGNPGGGNPPSQRQISAGAPAAPGAPSLTVGAASLGVSFSWPPHTGAAFSGFGVWYCTAIPADCTNATTKSVSTNVSNPSTTISGLTNGTKYWVRVRATNLNGTGPWSNASSATPLGAPQAPGSLSVVGGKSGNTLVGSGTLNVSWTEPNQANNMANVTGYKVLYRACTATPKSCTQNPAWGVVELIDAHRCDHVHDHHRTHQRHRIPSTSPSHQQRRRRRLVAVHGHTLHQAGYSCPDGERREGRRQARRERQPGGLVDGTE